MIAREALLERLIRCGASALVILTCVLSTYQLSTVVAGENSLGRKIQDFELQDFRGHRVALPEFAERRAVVVCFLGTDCPLAQFYGPRLETLFQEFRDDVAFVAIDANVQDSLTEMAAYARKHELTFPFLKDVGNRVADQFGAQRTPEVFLLDEERVIRYQGRVDGTFTFGSGVGLAKPQETRADLRVAIEELLGDKPISVAVTESKGCIIGRVREVSEQPTVTYSNQISRIFQNRCLSCHREGQIAPFVMDSYSEVAGWGEMIAEVVREQRMPPWHAGEKSTGKFLNDARLSEEEKHLIQQWVDEGCPEGDPADLPAPREFHEGWFTPGGPDQVIYMSDEPVPVKAEGIEEYRYYEVPGFQEDKWVKAAECMPGNHAVVHHIIVYARPPGGEPIAPGSIGIETRHFSWIAGFAPGVRPLEPPKGWSRMIPAGYSLVFEMHYTPIGTPQTDRSSIGLVFMDEKDVERVVHTGAILNAKFEIPENHPNYPVEAERVLKHDALVFALFPHMHVRGKSFRYELIAPDGSKEILLDVPRYDFNWQNSYILSEPRLIPKGTLLRATAHFDNSENNLANPDPTKPIRWGRQSWEEMMIGFYDVGVTVEQKRQLLEQKIRQRDKEERERKQEQAGAAEGH